MLQEVAHRSCELANPAQMCQIASQAGVLFSAGCGLLLAGAPWWLSCCWLEDTTEPDAAGRGTVVDLLAEAPWRRCWQGHHGGSVGQGAKEVLLAEGTVAKRMAAPW